ITNTLPDETFVGIEITNTQENGHPPGTKKEGAPLSWIVTTTAVNNNSEKVNNAPLECDIDFANTSYPDFYPYLEVDVNNTSEPTDDLKEIDFAETTYHDFYPYLDVNNISRQVISEPTKPESEATDDKESQTERYESSREAWSYMHQQARKFKDKIRHENLLIDQRNKRLEEQTIQLEREKQDFVVRERDLLVRESVVSEAEP